MKPSSDSGIWMGFTVAPGKIREWMDVSLTLAPGSVQGSGTNSTGAFTLDGTYDPETGEIRWTKTQPGRPSITGRGFLDEHGIWGTWEATPAGSCGFHLRPESDAWRRMGPAFRKLLEQGHRPLPPPSGFP
jgi:hypothetical protein